ncbi:MAG TPA: hypothetical protein VKY19_04035 [Ktedonosporobacter sp.]|jgi:DNA-directed RNA polymerase specialized sigma24 family protein|nr:hypothetical protein [Ktedonosporobacter sp.]
MCLRWSEAQRQHRQRQTNPIPLNAFDDVERSFIEDIIDPLMPEPDEVLIRQDLVTLLDRALGYLPDTTRTALELRYLAELPQKAAYSTNDSVALTFRQLLRSSRLLFSLALNRGRATARDCPYSARPYAC